MTWQEVFVSAVRSSGDLAGVFEYDGQTGYFYLYRVEAAVGGKIADALHILSGDIDFARADLSVRWNVAETKVALFIRGTMWGVFDCNSGQKFCGDYRVGRAPDLPSNFEFAELS
ncbi:MAG TPA: DUF2251 domain-containing protein [Pseudolabrys sp.]|nr:DUF2251 domain-containing protein [Pseudolabrys sp.]